MPTEGLSNMAKRKRCNQIIGFNPSARNEISLDTSDLDRVKKIVEEASLKFASAREKNDIILMIGLIQKRLREEPDFEKKLKDFLRLDEYLFPKKKTSQRTSLWRKEITYELGC